MKIELRTTEAAPSVKIGDVFAASTNPTGANWLITEISATHADGYNLLTGRKGTFTLGNMHPYRNVGPILSLVTERD